MAHDNPRRQNIASYVRWRGDVPFAQRGFGLADNVVLCKLAYYDFAPLQQVAGPDGLTLRSCAQRLGDSAHLTGTGDPDEFLSLCAASHRFGDVVLRQYVDLGDEQRGLQFCAMEFVLGKRVSYVAFRGTDSSLVGWREDFEMSYKRIPAQEEAHAYLQRIMRDGWTYLVGGHSKGATLAQYATLALDRDRMERVRRVYLNDGPGLCPDVVSTKCPRDYRRKAIRILPEHSIVGRLFEANDIPKIVVSSTTEGIMEHDLGTWEVADGHLVRVAQHDHGSDWFATSFAQWMRDVPTHKREEFVDELFEVVRAGGTGDASDFSVRGWDGVEDMLQAFVHCKGGAKVTLVRLPLRAFVGDVVQRVEDKGLLRWLLTSDIAHSIELVALGVAFLAAQGDALLGLVSLLMAAFVALLVLETAWRLRQRGGVAGEGWRVALCVLVALLYATTLVKDGALFVYASTLLGLGLIAMSRFFVCRVRERGNNAIPEALIAVLLAISAVFVLVAPLHAIDPFTSLLGVLFVVAGMLSCRYARG